MTACMSHLALTSPQRDRGHGRGGLAWEQLRDVLGASEVVTPMIEKRETTLVHGEIFT